MRRGDEPMRAEDQLFMSGLPKYCDMVMKGGITSGVVYPTAVCELAKQYQFKNIGGASAGAIAAAAAAAAEYGRQNGIKNSFEELGKLPNEFGRDNFFRVSSRRMEQRNGSSRQSFRFPRQSPRFQLHSWAFCEIF
jgi:predicted acylesterase/phospholipase RssA